MKDRDEKKETKKKRKEEKEELITEDCPPDSAEPASPEIEA